MAYCGKCGTKVDEGVKFCPSCGNPMEAPAPEQQAQTQQAQPAGDQNDFSAKIAALNNTADTTADFDKVHVPENQRVRTHIFYESGSYCPCSREISKFCSNHKLKHVYCIRRMESIWNIPA